jgi:hypothetical protein
MITAGKLRFVEADPAEVLAGRVLADNNPGHWIGRPLFMAPYWVQRAVEHAAVGTSAAVMLGAAALVAAHYEGVS